MSISYEFEADEGYMAETIEFSVDMDSEIPVYRQIENQVTFGIVSGAYRTGDRLPSVREMAGSTGVNANTVTKAYRDLELMGLIVTRRGVGVQVGPDAAKRCRGDVLAMVRRHLRMSVGEGLACGMREPEIQQCIKEALASNVPAYESN